MLRWLVQRLLNYTGPMAYAGNPEKQLRGLTLSL